ncbi:MAG: FMN-binding negative transcriptional regulator [Rhodobiaceae bacterium]|nr:FMN-binding negative transcriptional regulator [Rhodobiaceae bacterium]
MYVPEFFSPPDETALAGLIHAHPFGTLVSDDLQASHIPFLLQQEEEGLVLCGHVAKANPHWQVFDGASPALAIFLGPDGYISPSWGDCSKLVPTWNYMIVHARGVPQVVEGRADKVHLLHLMTEAHEASQSTPWAIGDLDGQKLEQLLEALVVFRMPVTSLEGKWKLSQNRAPADKAAFIDAVEARGDIELAAAMKQA